MASNARIEDLGARLLRAFAPDLQLKRIREHRWECADCGAEVEEGELFCADGCRDSGSTYEDPEQQAEDLEADFRMDLQRESES